MFGEKGLHMVYLLSLTCLIASGSFERGYFGIIMGIMIGYIIQ